MFELMKEVTRILNAIDQGEPHAAAQLLPVVYDELRKLAAQRLAQEKPGQTLQATALVHEAYVRLVDVDEAQHWNSRGHFFAAAAEAMRRILVESARRKNALRRGGDRQRLDLDLAEPAAPRLSEDLLALDAALEKLAAKDPGKAEVVKLRYFAGLTMEQTAESLGISLATANRWWNYARAWLHQEISGPEGSPRMPVPWRSGWQATAAVARRRVAQLLAVRAQRQKKP
jgi:RNA polymerase sigma factor (TIGR02999 family)